MTDALNINGPPSSCSRRRRNSTRPSTEACAEHGADDLSADTASNIAREVEDAYVKVIRETLAEFGWTPTPEPKEAYELITEHEEQVDRMLEALREVPRRRRPRPAQSLAG